MTIIYKDEFKTNLNKIIDFISKDSQSKAKIFLSSLRLKIKNLPNMPFKCRKSYYYDNDNVRDLIFKGYTIPFLVDEQENLIAILDIFKWTDVQNSFISQKKR